MMWSVECEERSVVVLGWDWDWGVGMRMEANRRLSGRFEKRD